MSSEPHLERDFTGYGRRPVDPCWPGGARIAVNFVMNIEEGSEPSVPDGDAASETGLTEGGAGNLPGRDLAAESMFEYGSRVGYWRLVRLLEERNLPATAMACGLALQRNPEIVEHLRVSNFDIDAFFFVRPLNGGRHDYGCGPRHALASAGRCEDCIGRRAPR